MRDARKTPGRIGLNGLDDLALADSFRSGRANGEDLVRFDIRNLCTR